MVLTASSPPLRYEPQVFAAGPWRRLAFTAMGTPCSLQYYSEREAQSRDFNAALLAWLADFEMRYSRFRSDSLISRINEQAGGEPVEVDAGDQEIFALCDWYHWSTQGLFDPTVLPLQLLWDEHRRAGQLPTGGRVHEKRALIDWRSVERTSNTIRLPRAGMAMDLGGIGKEYAVDRVHAMAADHNITSVLIDFGQDIRVSGSPPEGGKWRIGLEHPDDPERCWAGVAVSDRAVCVSGNYRRYVEIEGKKFGHIVDPRTGWPTSHGTRSAAVIAPTCTAAGILSTVSFILGAEDGVRLIEASSQACGALWTGKSATITRGFMDYVYED